jgi:hypothetical protein
MRFWHGANSTVQRRIVNAKGGEERCRAQIRIEKGNELMASADILISEGFF